MAHERRRTVARKRRPLEQAVPRVQPGTGGGGVNSPIYFRGWMAASPPGANGAGSGYILRVGIVPTT